MQPKSLLPAALAVAAVSAQNATNDTLTGVLSSNSNLSSVAALIGQYPALASTLESTKNVTLLAPSNAALAALTNSSVFAQAGAIPGYIQALLEYHVLNGTYYASDITSTPNFIHTLLTNESFANVTDGQVVECVLDGTMPYFYSGLKANASVVQANINYTNGVIHIIDSVLSLPGNASSVAEAANLTALAGALQTLNLTDTVDEAHDVTVFAPNNAAFQAIGSALGNLSTTELISILEYHIINGTVAYSTDIMNGSSVMTMNGGNVTLREIDGDVFVNSAKVINPNILISGGVMHVIDAVLNPNDTSAMPNTTASTAAPAYSGATSASTVPYTSGVATPTSSNAALQSAATTTGGANGAGAASGAASGTASSSSSSAIAPAMTTGAVGAAALFGGAAMLANL